MAKIKLKREGSFGIVGAEDNERVLAAIMEYHKADIPLSGQEAIGIRFQDDGDIDRLVVQFYCEAFPRSLTWLVYTSVSVWFDKLGRNKYLVSFQPNRKLYQVMKDMGLKVQYEDLPKTIIG